MRVPWVLQDRARLDMGVQKRLDLNRMRGIAGPELGQEDSALRGRQLVGRREQRFDLLPLLRGPLRLSFEALVHGKGLGWGKVYNLGRWAEDTGWPQKKSM